MSRLLQYLPWRRRRPTSHSREAALDALWIVRVHELAVYRRTVWGWA